MYTMDQIMLDARAAEASDIHISEGLPLRYRIHGSLQDAKPQPDAGETVSLLMGMLDEAQVSRFRAGQDLDFAVSSSDGNRQRVNVFHQQGKMAATIRLLNNDIPTAEELKLPQVIMELAAQPRGLVLVTGPTGSGKSTTLAAMVDLVNRTRADHIITIEDPIEYVHAGKRALVHQREVGRDVASFASALRSALREDPDIILVGEMRDYETISAALTAAETGHLVLSTLHTTGAAQTMDRIIDACPGETQNQVRAQLAGVLKGVVTQCLVPRLDGKRVVATEILVGSDAALNLIREGKTYQLPNIMQTAAGSMHTLNMDLQRLVRAGQIDRETAMKYTNNRKELEQFL